MKEKSILKRYKMIKRFMLRVVSLFISKLPKRKVNGMARPSFIERAFDLLLWCSKLGAYDYESRIFKIESLTTSGIMKEKPRIGIIIDNKYICILKESFIEKSVEYLKENGYTVKEKKVKK